MHHIRILTTGPDGRVTISKTELENLLAIAYQDGLEDGRKEAATTNINDWTVPHITCLDTTSTCTHADKTTCTCDELKTVAKTNDNITKTTKAPTIHATYTVTPEQAKKLSEQVSELFGANSISTVNDVFANLKKELGL
jgi:hypothetical protein